MSEKSKDFEQKIHRIYELLERSGASVTWNDRIPDPDNLPNLRQIDVSIRNGDLITLIECRIHKPPQNVKWIEELIGRKESLNADAIIGVSSSGFTKGAIKKAAAKGIILCDLKELSDDEIVSWGGYIKVSLFYYQFKEVQLTLFFDDITFEKVKLNNIHKELNEQHVIHAIFDYIAEIIDKEKLFPKKLTSPTSKQERKFKVRLNSLQLQNITVQHLIIEGKCELIEKQKLYPEVFSFGDPKYNSLVREVQIQQFKGGETEIIHNLGKVSISIDISKLNLPDLALFRYANYEASDEVFVEHFSIFNPEQTRIKSNSLKINIARVSNFPTMTRDN